MSWLQGEVVLCELSVQSSTLMFLKLVFSSCELNQISPYSALLYCPVSFPPFVWFVYSPSVSALLF